jgi:hypothetical protein
VNAASSTPVPLRTDFDNINKKVTTLVTKLLLHHQRNVIDIDKILEGNQVRTFDARF